jgi:hypothetical protein
LILILLEWNPLYYNFHKQSLDFYGFVPGNIGKSPLAAKGLFSFIKGYLFIT